MSQIHPAHRIDAELFGRFFKPDRRAVGLVHRLALFILNQAMPKQCAERFLVLGVIRFVVTHHGGQRQHRIKPVAELAGEAFCHQVRWIPLLPFFAIGVVAHRAERHDPRVEPRIADVRDAAHPLAFFAGRLAFDDHSVDPRTVWRVAFEISPAFD